MTSVAPHQRLGFADFYAHHGGGGLFTQLVNQRIGACLCVLAQRLRLVPTALTITNLILGISGSALIMIFTFKMHAGEGPGAPAGLTAVALWQLAYSLDCADGQLARATSTTSPAGARVDILCDAAVHISVVIAISALTSEFSPDVPRWIPSAFAAIWLANLVAPLAFARGSVEGSLLSVRNSTASRVLGTFSDYGAVVTLFGLVLTFAPRFTASLMAFFVAGHAVVLVIRIVVAARASVGHH